MYACVMVPRPWKYFPQTRQAYTLIRVSETEHSFSKSKSSRFRLIVSKYGQSRNFRLKTDDDLIIVVASILGFFSSLDAETIGDGWLSPFCFRRLAVGDLSVNTKERN